jgi:YbgC/YbaW family acyl-CoA thioester hydrolase
MADFVRQVPVHWNDCDPAGIVFHSHYVRWMDEGFHEMARARGIDFLALQAADPGFRGTPLVNVGCTFRSPAQYGAMLEHRIAVPVFGNGRSFRVNHFFYNDGTLVADGEQVRVWGTFGPGKKGLLAVPVPADIAVRLRGEASNAL